MHVPRRRMRQCSSNVKNTKKIESSASLTARDFAIQNSKRVTRTNGAESTILRHGGINNIKPSLLSLINYIATFRENENITPAEIGGLVYASCKNNGFGKLNSRDIPVYPMRRYREKRYRATEAHSSFSHDSMPEERVTENAKLVGDWRSVNQRRIDRIDSHMRKGYSSAEGESYRAFRRRLKDRTYRECR